MIKEIIEKWEENKNILKEKIETTPQEQYEEYIDIVKLLVCCILPEYDYENITLIDDGEWQGTQIFIIPKKTYQPNIREYIYTHNYYGSCSHCDTLLWIKHDNHRRVPTEQQVKDYMKLCLDLIENMRYLYNEKGE